MPALQTQLQIRWMIRRDLPHVLCIERASFPLPWDESDFVGELRNRKVIGLVATAADDQIVGFQLYRLHPRRLELINFAVHPAYRRRHVGSRMLDYLKRKLSANYRNEITTLVRETNVPAQLFFRANGFLYSHTEPRAYDDDISDEDGYVLSYLVQP